MSTAMHTVIINPQASWYQSLEFMVLVLSIHGISSMSLRGTWVCRCGHDDTGCGVAVCTGDGCVKPELVCETNSLFVGGTTGGIC